MFSLSGNELLFPRMDFNMVHQNVYKFVKKKTHVEDQDALSSLPKELLHRLTCIITDAVERIEAIVTNSNHTQLSLSFNGGKDCTILLYLLVAVYQEHFPNRSWPISTFFIQNEKNFIEELAFVGKCEARYHLHIEKFANDMRSSLFQYHTLHPEITTVLVGTRRTDPFASTLDYVQRCDPDWPPFLRVHPILDWSFHDVWLFLNTLNVEYCVLYDQGYTSLGDSRYTVPNPQLKSDSCPYGYLPAWKLKDETQERAGRQSVPKKLKQDLKC